MPKRLRFFISSLLSVIFFFLLLSLPVDNRYLFLAITSILMVFLWWFGAGVWKESLVTKVMIVILPLIFFVGYTLFSMLLPFSVELLFLLSLVLLGVFYVLFLVENIFLVALSFKTVPLYRAAWTVSLLLTLLASFFIFNSLWSFRFVFWINALVTAVISVAIYSYTYWVVRIETGNKESKDTAAYVAIPSLVTAELALVFSFWPVGIFNGSLYLVWSVFILASLMQADIRERLFKKTMLSFLWMVAAIILAAVITTSWR